MAELRSAGRTVVFFEAPHRIVVTLGQIARLVGNRQVSIARELTKAHEEFVRGPINDVLKRLPSALGEFTVVIDMSIKTEDAPELPTNEVIVREYGRMTSEKGLSRRRVINQLARIYGIPPNQVYETIERSKKLG
jgi:16S rRNA (cytidine1402-2'-O)-methyltransferase